MTVEGPSRLARWPVTRIRAGQTMRVQLLSDQWVRLVTHFHKTTFLCPEVPECDACLLLPPRPYWYLPVLIPHTHGHAIIELSAHATSDLEQKIKFCGLKLVPGVQVEVARSTPKAPLRIEVIGQEEQAPTAPLHDWVSCLMALYKLPVLRPVDSLADYGARVLHLVKARADLIAAERKASAEAGAKSRR